MVLLSFAGCGNNNNDIYAYDIYDANDAEYDEYENDYGVPATKGMLERLKTELAEAAAQVVEEVAPPRINLAELFNWETREFEDIRHLLGELIFVQSITDYEILGGGGVTFRSYNFENGNSVIFWFDDIIQSIRVNYEQTQNKTGVHFNEINGTSHRNDIVATLGEPTFSTSDDEGTLYIYDFIYDFGDGFNLPVWNVGFTLDDNLMVTAISVALHIN